jgi:hypothetical protein
MKPENKVFLDQHRIVYDHMLLSEELKHFDNHIKFRLIDIIKEEWAGPGYQINPSCGDCVMGMVKFAYVQYDKYLKEQERIVAMTFPVNEPPTPQLVIDVEKANEGELKVYSVDEFLKAIEPPPSESQNEPPNNAPSKPNHKRKTKR